VCGKKPKTIEIRGQSIKKYDFFAVPTSHTQMGSLSAKNAIEKFSCLGTFKIGTEAERFGLVRIFWYQKQFVSVLAHRFWDEANQFDLVCLFSELKQNILIWSAYYQN
jgi:hypothetical protein